jgi:hypothetical protein
MNLPQHRLPTKTPLSTDMKYPTFIVMTAIMLRDALTSKLAQTANSIDAAKEKREMKKKMAYSKYDTPASTTSIPAIQTASSALQRLLSTIALLSPISRCWCWCWCWYCPLSLASTSDKLNRTATRARNSTARIMRNMHVPAYWAVVAGDQETEKRGVRVEVKKVMDMVDMSIFIEVVVGMDVSDGPGIGVAWVGMFMFMFMVVVYGCVLLFGGLVFLLFHLGDLGCWTR